MDNDLLHLAALHRIPGIGNVLIRQLISYAVSPSIAFFPGRASLANIPVIGSFFADSILPNPHAILMEAYA